MGAEGVNTRSKLKERKFPVSEMVTSQNFLLNVAQGSIFTPEHSGFASGKAVGTVLAIFRDRFDGDMQVLPIPSEVPPEIPRVILQSGDSQWRLTMAPARIDSGWHAKPAGAGLSLEAVAKECAEVLERYVRESHVRVGRVGLVVNRICSADKPAETLIQRFCNESSQREPFDRSESFEVHNHKVYLPLRTDINYKINSWVRCKSARLVADDRPAILIEQDLNTLPNESDLRRFAPEQIRDFFQMAALEADEILRKYFPG